MQKVAVVGTGYISTLKHLPAWRRQPRARLAAICDVSAERAAEVAARFEVPAVYTSVEEMLEKERPDVVDVCTPPRTHADLVVQALEAGAHVLVEKPMAVTLEECDRMIAAAGRSRRLLCVGHSDLFYPAVSRGRELVAQGAVGTLRALRILLSTPTGYMTSREDHWANQLPGGVIGESGPHVVYLTLAFANPIRQVRASGRKLLTEHPWSPYDEYAVELTSDAVASRIELHYTTDQWAAEVDLIGTEGRLRLDLESQVVRLLRRPSLSAGSVGRSTLGEAGQIVASAARTGAALLGRRSRTTHDLLIAALCDAIAEGRPAPVGADEGREAVRVMKEIVDQLEAVRV